MKAMQPLEPTKVELREIDMPVVGEHEVLLGVLPADVCQTDAQMRRTTEAWVPAGTIPGRETADEIVELAAAWRPGSACSPRRADVRHAGCSRSRDGKGAARVEGERS